MASPLLSPKLFAFNGWFSPIENQVYYHEDSQRFITTRTATGIARNLMIGNRTGHTTLTKNPTGSEKKARIAMPTVNAKITQSDG